MNIEHPLKYCLMTTQYRITGEQLLSDEWGKLRKISYETGGAGNTISHKAELYDTGNAVAVLLYSKARRTVLLNRQFRIAIVCNGHPSGMLTEVCAGKIDDLPADATVLKEIREETGFVLPAVQKVLSVYMSPGAFTERLDMYIAEYSPEQKQAKGGGLKEEGEDIEVLEVPFDDALKMIGNGEIIDAKTIILLQYAALNGIV